MASLKEIKGRIASVSTTLKTTSAMKMVASAKLHKAQSAIGNRLPYEKYLHSILENLLTACAADESLKVESAFIKTREIKKVAIVAFSSNSSLCGGFNSNAIKMATSTIEDYLARGYSRDQITVFSIGRKMADAMKKIGYQSPSELNYLSDCKDYSKVRDFASTLMDMYSNGEIDKIELVYNHFKSTSSQPSVRESYLPFNIDLNQDEGQDNDFIIEPTAAEVLETLLPRVLSLKMFTTILDTSAAEHAARTVAMQTATDNGNEILEELTLQYNKSRQQKITNELLDIIGGTLQ